MINEPHISLDQAPENVYRSYLERGELGYQRCDDCGSAIFYPRVLCPGCGSTSLIWMRSEGRGVVHSTTTVHRRGEEPHNVSLVDLSEGFRVMTNVHGLPSDEIVIGQQVRLQVTPTEQGHLPLFVVDR